MKKGDKMSKGVLVTVCLVILFALITAGCGVDNYPYSSDNDFSRRNPLLAPDLPMVSYDSTIALASIDGFRVGTSARTAREVAIGEGWRVSPKLSNLTFEDIIEGRTTNKFGDETLYLYNMKHLFRNLHLSFKDGMLYSIHLSQAYSDRVPKSLPHRQQAEEALNDYLKKYPSLSLSEERGNFRVYSYKPNASAFLIVTIYHDYPSELLSQVGVSVYDSNYTQGR